jgi:hypothetical protein
LLGGGNVTIVPFFDSIEYDRTLFPCVAYKGKRKPPAREHVRHAAVASCSAAGLSRAGPWWSSSATRVAVDLEPKMHPSRVAKKLQQLLPQSTIRP